MGEVQQLDGLVSKCNILKQETAKVIIGQKDIINKVLIAMFCGGHCLLTGVPGLAKTLLVKTLAQVLDVEFNRVQFTPDLMPSDITGSEILDNNRQFQCIKGPLFTNILLADEINRTSPKTQAALLQAMQEKDITVSGKTYLLEEPFFVMATQNPIEQEGTYPLPEAQLDRFMFMLIMDYPSFEEEVNILKTTTTQYTYDIKPVMNKQDIIDFRKIIMSVPVSDNVYDYIVRLVGKTRVNNAENDIARQYLVWGAGPRACQNIVLAAKCNAVLNGKYSPDMEDVNQVCKDVLRHRIVLNYSAQSESITADDVIDKIIEQL